MNNNLENPYYYLENFQFVLSWVLQRYRDLLEPAELGFIEQFQAQPIESRALLVRMIMRKGSLFRSSKLAYAEIGDTNLAAQPLLAQGWISADPVMSLEQLFALLTKSEFAQALALPASGSAKKADLLDIALAVSQEPRRYSDWCGLPDVLYAVDIDAICDCVRLMFFGNLHQDWSEFVLADLGIYTYEKVPFSVESRAFHVRRDIDIYLQLHACRERLHEGEALLDIEREVSMLESANPWLSNWRAKLLFQIGQAHEKLEDVDNALRVYGQCDYPGARGRRIRVLEKAGLIDTALILAEQAESAPEGGAEIQHLQRILPRLRRKSGLKLSKPDTKAAAPRFDLILPRPEEEFYVEEVARQHITQQNDGAPVYYVENALINSLLGLLCWDVIFSAIPGAFFHPFQAGPADLHSADFVQRRMQAFQQCLAQLESQEYQQTIRGNFMRKAGIQSPFVYWDVLSEALLDGALLCFPANHLARWFERILDDIAANRSGFPDLIQFWPQERRYRMIEVKGPGDRLQDNQLRFLHFCQQHHMPVAVCHVAWEGAAT
jgi:hypothetical protein